MTTHSYGIHIAGVWLWPWAVWHVAWLAGMFLPLTGWGVDLVTYYTWLYAVFLPMEVVGSIDLQDDHGSERAKTLSQWRQYVASMAKDGTKGPLSWKGLAAGSGLVDALLASLVVHQNLEPLGGWSVVAAGLVGISLALWLVPHYGWREIVS